MGSLPEQTLRNRAEYAIAHGALTNSKRPQCFIDGVYPSHLTIGHGCQVIDWNGKKYIDFICGLGSNILGYGNHLVAEAAHKRLKFGVNLSLPSAEEVIFAENIKAVFPYIDRLRILKSGSEGCSAAIRIARAYTGRKKVAALGYHGWHDEFTSLTPPANGVVSFGQIDKIMNDVTDYAAVILEPAKTDWGTKIIGYLQALRDVCTKNSIVLIYDETITACRFQKMSVANATGIYPDISVFGKALANGLPISVVGGKKDIMECDYFVSSTFAGDTVACAAANVVLQELSTMQKIEGLWNRGGLFLERFNALKGPVWIEGYNTRGVFAYDNKDHYDLFLQETCKAGLLFGPSWFWCLPHDDYLDEVLSVCKAVFKKIKDGQTKLEGLPSNRPFAQVVREE